MRFHYGLAAVALLVSPVAEARDKWTFVPMLTMPGENGVSVYGGTKVNNADAVASTCEAEVQKGQSGDYEIVNFGCHSAPIESDHDMGANTVTYAVRTIGTPIYNVGFPAVFWRLDADSGVLQFCLRNQNAGAAFKCTSASP